MQAEVDTHNTTRVTTGINQQNFDWKLDCGESFQTPEAVVVFSNQGFFESLIVAVIVAKLTTELSL